jgi:hypothetical protein
VVVQDDGVPVGELAERRQRHVVEAGPAVHEQQRVAVSDDLDVEGHARMFIIVIGLLPRRRTGFRPS